MSGIDEQPTDIPICPVCGERPKYWSLYSNREGSSSGGWMWLVSEKEQPHHKSRRIVCNGFFNLDTVKSIRCRPDVVGLFTKTRHLFVEGSEVFNAVMKAARREQNERNR